MTPMNKQQPAAEQPVLCGGLPVRTNLRAGLAWDDLDDQAKALWDKLTSSLPGAKSSTTTPTAKPAA